MQIPQRLSSATRSVSDLTGPDWLRWYRFLHAAFDVDQERMIPRRWFEVARRRSVHIDLAEADWYEASGHRLHYPRPDAAFADEPADGPTPRVQVPLLRTLPRSTGPPRSGSGSGTGTTAVLSAGSCPAP